jgi:hypothetical protein
VLFASRQVKRFPQRLLLCYGAEAMSQTRLRRASGSAWRQLKKPSDCTVIVIRGARSAVVAASDGERAEPTLIGSRGAI